MKEFVIFALAISASWGQKRCNKGTDSNFLTVEVCAEEVSTCTSPMFVEYTGMSSQAYGCGVCGDAKDRTCKECTAEDGADPCNMAVSAPADAKTFECYAYTYDAGAKKFNAAKTPTTCHAKKDTAVKCNSPGEKAEAAYRQENGGCGSCAVGTVDEEICWQCNGTGCNTGGKMCNKGTDINFLTVEVCAGEVSTCTSPMFVEYTGMSSQAYGCGVCGDAKDKTCKECTAEVRADPFNTAVSAPTDTKTFECYGYTYDADTENFKAAKTANTCHTLKSTLVRCNSPGKKADAAYVQSNH